jgi:hypothetical protein
MPSRQTTVVQQDWSFGLARDVAPALIYPAGAYDMADQLLDELGNPYRRGGTANDSDASPGGTAILDAFTRADENPVSDGGKWVGPVVEGADLKVSGDTLKAAAGLGSAVYDKTITDGEMYVTVVTTGAAPTFDLYIRTAKEGTYAAATGYKVEIFKVGIDWYWALKREDGAGGPALDIGIHDEVNDGDTIALRAVGSEISAWHLPSGGDWARQVVGTDATYTSGRMAVGIAATDSVLDNFGGGSLTPFTAKGLNWVWDGYLLPGERTVFASEDDFGVHDADKRQVNIGGAGLALPKQSATIEDLLFIGGGTIYAGSRLTAAYSTGTVEVTNASTVVKGTTTKWATNADAGMLFQIGAERVYVVASVDSDTQITLRDAYEGTGGAGKTYALSPVYTVGSDPYESWDFLTVCANRLVIATGRTIRVTEIDNPHTFTNSLGTTNEHTVPGAVQIVGLATVGQTVLVFTTGGIWSLTGLALDIVDQNGNAQHQLQQLSSDVVLAGAAGLAGSGQQLVVPAVDGIYLMDGISTPQRVSTPLDRLYMKRIADGYLLGGAKVYRGHYFLPILDSSGNVRDNFVCGLNRPRRTRQLLSWSITFPWSRFTGDGGEIACYAVRSTTDPREPTLLGAQARTPSQVVDCSAYFDPDAAHKNDADGSTHDFALITRDMETGGMASNSIRSLRLRYELVDAADDHPIVKVYWSDGSLEGGGPMWDEVNWDEFDYASDDDGGAIFNSVDTDGPVSDGRRRYKFHINKKLPYGRFLIKTSGPAASFVLRSLEMVVRPSQAARK